MAGRIVLLVEDSDAVRCTFAAVLEDDGHQVIEAASLAESRAVLAASTRDGVRRRVIEVAIVDLNLPDGLGTTLSTEIRSHHPEAAIVLMSGADPGPAVGAIDLVVEKGALPIRSWRWPSA